MSAASERELQTRISDLEGALRGIRRIADDANVTPKAKLQRIQGVLFMYPDSTEPAGQS